MSNCFKKYDLNPKTCKFVSKCPEGKIRDENFKCVNKTEMKSKARTETNTKTKKKINYEEILRKRTDDLRDLFKSKTNAWETVLKKNIIRTKLMNIRDQSEKRGYDDLTRNVTKLLKRVDVYTGNIKTNRNGNPVSIFDYNSNKVNLNLGKRTRKHANVSL
jgi:hypothetical protein